MNGGVATIGHINLDHVVSLNQPIRPDVTSLIESRSSPAGGRLGGCAANIAAGVAAAGIATEVVAWVGDDPDGHRVVEQLQGHGVGTSGIVCDPGRRTGSTWLPSVPGGESYCIYDPGGPPPAELSPVQGQRVAANEWLVAAVGPPAPCADAIGALRVGGHLLWAVKADPASVPAPLAGELVGRADVIVLNESERRFLADSLGADWEADTRPDALIVETLGARGARYRSGGRWRRIEAPVRLELADAVGAGDAFVAGLLSGVIAGFNVDHAVRAGIESAADLLAGRLREALVR